MSLQSWVMYLGLVVLATASPGPAVLFITTNSLLYGWKKSIYAALGNIAGLFCLGVIAVTGLGAVLTTSVFVFNIVKYAGAAYLVFLGLKLIFQKSEPSEIAARTSVKLDIPSVRLFFQALGVALSNPKAVVFLTALFPQFINVNEPLIYQFSILILVLMLFSFFFLMLYSLLANQAKSFLAKPGKAKIVNRTSGSVFVGFGILLAASSNR